MITAYKTYGTSKNTYEMYGLSTDEKPTADVANASIFYEMDTKKIYMFDEQNGQWLEQ